MRSLRRGAGASLNDAALIVGKSKGHLSQVERGVVRPSPELIARWDNIYNGDGVLWSAYVAARAPRALFPSDQDHTPIGPVPGDASEFVDDVTIPDGTVVALGQHFVKTWRIRNTGTVPWIGRYLTRVGPPAAHGLPRSPVSVPIQDTAPGETVDISVPMRAPLVPGTAQIMWKMTDDAGREYFPDRYPNGLIVTVVMRDFDHEIRE